MKSLFSSRLSDSILAACLCIGFLSGCVASAPATYDLSALPLQKMHHISGQIAVAKPAALQVFSSDRILVKDGQGTISHISGAQWADQLPDLVQTRLVHSFENASNISSVFKTGAGIGSDYLLSSEIRSFHVESARGQAVVEISVKLVSERSGRIVRARVFRAEYPASAQESALAVEGLNQALGEVMENIVRWTSGRSR
jgi:ABC-type uncharacterized transport system, auxiliary component